FSDQGQFCVLCCFPCSKTSLNPFYAMFICQIDITKRDNRLFPCCNFNNKSIQWLYAIGGISMCGFMCLWAQGMLHDKNSLSSLAKFIVATLSTSLVFLDLHVSKPGHFCFSKNMIKLNSFPSISYLSQGIAYFTQLIAATFHYRPSTTKGLKFAFVSLFAYYFVLFLAFGLSVDLYIALPLGDGWQCPPQLNWLSVNLGFGI